MLREIAGIKLAIIGVTTPGMPFWFRPEFARGIDFQYSGRACSPRDCEM